MTVPSKGFTTLTYAFGSLLTSAKMTQLMDNTTHLEEWMGLDFTAAQNHDHNAINSKAFVIPANTIGINELKRQRESLYFSSYNSATLKGSVDSIGTANVSGIILLAPDATDNWISYGGVATTTGYTYHITTTRHTQSRHSPIIRMRVKMDSDLSERRMWWGLLDDAFAPHGMSLSSTPDTIFAGFRYATDVDGTAFWRCVTIDGTGASAEETTTTTAIAVGTIYELKIELTATSATFYIDGTEVAEHTSVVPTITTDLDIFTMCKSLLGGGGEPTRVSYISLIQSVTEA